MSSSRIRRRPVANLSAVPATVSRTAASVHTDISRVVRVKYRRTEPNVSRLEVLRELHTLFPHGKGVSSAVNNYCDNQIIDFYFFFLVWKFKTFIHYWWINLLLYCVYESGKVEVSLKFGTNWVCCLRWCDDDIRS